ncbi:MAG: DNA-processing protein DprA [Chloroflexota bacterium]|nr:DNA-processing protein DprA [Chloroflexota bacterium]
MIDPAWVALSLVERVGSKKLRALIAAFGSAEAALAADNAALQRIPGIGSKTAAAICELDLHEAQRAIQRWQSNGVRIITLEDSAYPMCLRALDDAPPTLFVRGVWDERASSGRAVAIVGTRSPSQQAEAAAQHIAFTLAANGYTIVSGLARGIDTQAHMGALACSGGCTLAVLGGGVLNVYPPENMSRAKAISMYGALISEQMPYAESKPTYLVARNRIITGLCEAVIVIETELDGGAMHAARRALEQGRKLYTLDLPASGNRALIEAGASVVSVSDPQIY